MGFGFRVKQLDYDLTPVAALALVGHHLKCLYPLFKRLDAQFPCRGGLPSSTLIRSDVGLLAQSKSDFDAIEGFRGGRVFSRRCWSGRRIVPAMLRRSGLAVVSDEKARA